MSAIYRDHTMPLPESQGDFADNARERRVSDRRDAERFRVDEMALLQGVSNYGLTANAIAAILVAVALWPGANTMHLLVWLVGMVSAIAQRFLLHRAYGRAGSGLKEDANWERIIAGSNLLLGGAWGWLAFAFLSADSTPHNIAVVAAMALVVVSAQSLCPSRVSLAVFLLSALLPLMAKLLLIDAAALAAPVLLIFALLLTAWFVLNRYRDNLAANMARFEQRSASDAAMIRGAETANRLFAQVVTERECAEAELKIAKQVADDANQAKGEFLAYTSHEIRTPLNAIIGFSDALLTSTLDNTQRDYSRRIKGAGTRLLTLINDLLDLAKIEAGKLNIEYAEFELRQTLDEVVQEQGVKAREKEITLDLVIDNEVPDVLTGDSLRLRQILLNLISNAIKFTPVRGKVAIRAQVVRHDGDGARIRFSVADTGIGIPPDKLGTMFERYTQADASTARKYGGTGLGLSICKSLVALMGGDILVSSEVGKGSVFSFELPFKAEAVAAGAGTTAPAPAPVTAPAEASVDPLKGMRVLVAEDNEHNQLLIELLLKKQGVECTLVENGAEAVEKLRKNNYDLIFMDLEMPVMGGFEAVAAIRREEQETGARRIIVALSAHPPEEQRERCIAAGMDEYLMKPFNVKALQATLRRFAPRADSTPAAQHTEA